MVIKMPQIKALHNKVNYQKHLWFSWIPLLYKMTKLAAFFFSVFEHLYCYLVPAPCWYHYNSLCHFQPDEPFICIPGQNCSLPVNACASDVNFCKNRGTCYHSGAGDMRCVCPPGIVQTPTANFRSASLIIVQMESLNIVLSSSVKKEEGLTTFVACAVLG